MKLTEEMKAKLAEGIGNGRPFSFDMTEEEQNNCADPEVLHRVYDEILHDHLKELDPEFVEEIDKLVADVEFWYA